MSAEIITFVKEKKVLGKCSFCQKPLIKGKFVREEDNKPAICFECIVECAKIINVPSNQ